MESWFHTLPGRFRVTLSGARQAAQVVRTIECLAYSFPTVNLLLVCHDIFCTGHLCMISYSTARDAIFIMLLLSELPMSDSRS